MTMTTALITAIAKIDLKGLQYLAIHCREDACPLGLMPVSSLDSVNASCSDSDKYPLSKGSDFAKCSTMRFVSIMACSEGSV